MESLHLCFGAPEKRGQGHCGPDMLTLVLLSPVLPGLQISLHRVSAVSGALPAPRGSFLPRVHCSPHTVGAPQPEHWVSFPERVHDQGVTERRAFNVFEFI